MSFPWNVFTLLNLTHAMQLVSVISMLSADVPNVDSPANVDAAKEVRNDPAGLWESGDPQSITD